jgi:hypothetical protein
MRRKKMTDARILKGDLDAIDVKIVELQEKRDKLKTDLENAEKAEILKIVFDAGVSMEVLRLIVADWQSQAVVDGAQTMEIVSALYDEDMGETDGDHVFKDAKNGLEEKANG